MKLGAHLSIAAGLPQALENIVAIGGNCLQIFSSSPRMWKMPEVTDEIAAKFRETKKRLGIDPVYFHATYLINLGLAGRIGELSKQTLIAELNMAAKLGVKGSIIHLGSFKEGQIKDKKDQQQPITEQPIVKPSAGFHPTNVDLAGENNTHVLTSNICQILDNTPKDTLFMIENAGNRKIGLTLAEIAKIIQGVGNARLRVCLDTCHLHAAGYDIKSEEKLHAFLNEFDKLIGLDKLELFHTNDSKDPFDAKRDRHENIGEGTIGLEAFRVLLNHPQTRSLPFIIETPGFDDKGPDQKNLDILKSLIK